MVSFTLDPNVAVLLLTMLFLLMEMIIYTFISCEANVTR